MGQSGANLPRVGFQSPAYVRGTGRPSLPGPEDARARPRRRARPPRGAARVGRAPRRIPGRAAPPPSALAKGLAPPRLARTVSCGQLRTLVARCSRARCTAHLDLSKGRAAPIPAGRIALGGLLPPSLPQPPRGRAAPRTLQGRLPHRWDKLGRGGRQSYFPLPSSKIPIGKMVPSSPRALFLLLLILACPEPRASQNCLSKQQLLSAIRQLQQLLKGQETRFAEGIRHMKSRLAALQNSVSRVAPDAPPVSCPALNAPADGRKFGSKYLVDHEVHFACNPGFRLVGPSSVVCLPNGTWTGEQPRCRDISECSSQPCQNGGTCVEGVNQYRCICPPGRTGNRCQHQAQTAAPEGSVAGDSAFSRAPRCAQVERAQHCSCEAGFHLSGAAGDSVCEDVNECELYGQEGRPRLCMHTCVNTPGSYRCTCPSGYLTLADGKSCEDVDECVGLQPVCPQGTTCINTGGSFQCVSPECPEGSGNVSYVKTSPFQCERNPCPMDSRPCRHLPKTISFHYLSLPSNLKTPITLFRMATASAPGRAGPNSLRFGIVGGSSRGHFVMQRSDRQTGELILVQTLAGPQTLEVDVDMSEYLDRSFQANHVSKVTIFVSPYDF
ncbi:fibulin-7 [Macaca mulatta]